MQSREKKLINADVINKKGSQGKKLIKADVINKKGSQGKKLMLTSSIKIDRLGSLLPQCSSAKFTPYFSKTSTKTVK